jgi:hypothetical protein
VALDTVSGCVFSPASIRAHPCPSVVVSQPAGLIALSFFVFFAVNFSGMNVTLRGRTGTFQTGS